MTIRKYVREYLEWAGMSPDQIEAVTEMAIRPESEGGILHMTQKIDNDLNSHLPGAKNVLTSAINQLALEYCEEHCPDAWFKQTFVK